MNSSPPSDAAAPEDSQDSPTVPYRLRVAASVTRYRACTVDPRPGRAVHCPDLNACLVNEGRPVPVDCNAVHFGYAIPVTVVPLPEEPDLAELVLDPSPDLSPEAVAYLLRHHPQLRDSDASMAATAKHEPLRRRKFAPEPEEDIAAIAKQISDHAEAIYQTWKSRGLAPTEILTCHSNATAADKFGTALTPTPSSSSPNPASPAKPQAQHRVPKKSPVVDLLAQAPSLDANNLEKLVSNFVSEDKARLAAQRQQQQSKNLPSSIQFALQKFEKQAPASRSPSPYGKQSQVLSPESPKAQSSPSKIPTAVSGGFSPHHSGSPSISSSTPVKTPTTPTPASSSYEHMDTVETTFPPDLVPNKQPKKPDSLSEPSSPVTGMSTWPLKNKVVGSTPDRRVSPSKQIDPQERKPDDAAQTGKYVTLPSNNNKASTNNINNKNSAYMDEVAREEERLINALKTGIIIAEEPAGISSGKTDKKSNLLLKKSKEKLIAGKKEKKPDLEEKEVKEEPKSPTEVLDKSSLSNLSLVDYAKARYRNAQQHPLTQQRLDDARQLRATSTPSPTQPLERHGTQEVISVARNRFQVGPRDWKAPGASPDQNAWEAEASTSRRAASGTRPRAGLDSVPHPELTTQQRQHIRAAAAAAAAAGPAGAAAGVGTAAAAAAAAGPNPVRPFLTRGSVAERVLIFEKCPTELMLEKQRHYRDHHHRSGPAISTWRSGHEVQAKAQTYSRAKENLRPTALQPNTTLQRHVKANRNVHIPRFYFPKGKPSADQQQEQILQKISAAFRGFPNQQVPRDKFHIITKACNCPLYWKVPLFIAAGGEKLGYVEANSFLEFWKTMCSSCHDAAARFFYILSKGQLRDLTTEDFIPLVQDVVDTHPGLTFLKEATEFHSRYVHTVITRIFYCVNRSWSGRISLPELRRSDLLRVIQLLEEEEDINQVTAYFSYEHFYVIYCKFWELDRDHDLYIDRQDLARHSDHALSTRMIDRVFSGAVTRGGRHREEKMSYTDFVWFLLSEEDKRHPTAIEYWFRCMDLDGDGYLSMYELEYFYEEQLQRMEAIGIETLPFEDCLCQMLDMIHPAQPGKISLSDLKRCKMTPIFFDTFFNLEKYLDHEQRDPFASQRDHDNDGHELSDWDRYAADEYELLVAEEGGNDQQDEQGFENSGDDILSPNLDTLVNTDGTSPMLDLGEDGCSEETAGAHWKSSFEQDIDEDSDNSADYAADSDECPV